VDDDEQQLVVSRRLGDRSLKRQQLRDPEVAPVGQLPVLFPEPGRSRFGDQLRLRPATVH
jgi:hypothetical protein